MNVSNTKKTPTQMVVGAMSIFALLALGLFSFIRVGTVEQPAVVQALRTFELITDDRGRYSWTIHDGNRARPMGFTAKRTVGFDREGAVMLSLVEGLDTGMMVKRGQVLASFDSDTLRGDLAELRANREALTSTKKLLLAGASNEEVAEAMAQIRVAEASRARLEPELRRVRSLHKSGVVSAQEAESIELRHRVQTMEVELAQRRYQVKQAPARPEVIESLDAELSALDIRIGAMAARVDDANLKSPIDGILEIGGVGVVLRVYDFDAAFIRFPVSESQRMKVSAQDTVRFSGTGSDRSVSGVVVEVSEGASIYNGRSVFYVSARLDDSAGLRAGMTGSVRVSSHRKNSFFSFVEGK